MIKFLKVFSLLFILNILSNNYAFAVDTDANNDFKTWLTSYKNMALKEGISEDTIKIVFKNVKFLDQVIKYDRKQPEFIEDTETYVNKRASKSRARIAEKLYKRNKDLFDNVEKKFGVEKEILLALWGIETNFGKHVGKMDIVSSLATLSYDKRRRDYFSSELLILLKLIDDKLIDHNTLYGSWAGAFGNFQFMPSTIRGYAIDYDKNGKIELKKSINDSLASAANYINEIGWKKAEPCYVKVKLSSEINKKYINFSARKISSKMKISKWEKKGVIILDKNKLKKNLKAALVIPDGKVGTPTFLVFRNYEKVLKWNRSLRFGISICTLANMIKT